MGEGEHRLQPLPLHRRVLPPSPPHPRLIRLNAPLHETGPAIINSIFQNGLFFIIVVKWPLTNRNKTKSATSKTLREYIMGKIVHVWPGFLIFQF